MLPDAGDVTHEVFLSAFQASRHYYGGSFIAWLLRIATNKALDYLHVRARRSSTSLDGVASVDAASIEVSDPGEGPDERVLCAELARDLEQQLDELPPDQRLAVIQSDIQGYSYEEIAASTGWPTGTVKSRLSRGRARLRNALRSSERRSGA